MLNRILTNADRRYYALLIDEMKKAIPEMMANKIEQANVQQAFAVDQIRRIYRPGYSVLCVGAYMDTACAFLKKSGISIVEIDPAINIDLDQFRNTYTGLPFDIIFSVSVIEHVANDEQFIADICKLLKPGGVAILTMDFKEGWTPAPRRSPLASPPAPVASRPVVTSRNMRRPLPFERVAPHITRVAANKTSLPVDKGDHALIPGDYRFYTSQDYARLARVMQAYDCFLLDEFSPDSPPDFEMNGFTYGFSTMIFCKLS